MVSAKLVFPIEMTATMILQKDMIGSEVPCETPSAWSKKLHRSQGVRVHLNYVSKDEGQNLTHHSMADVPGWAGSQPRSIL